LPSFLIETIRPYNEFWPKLAASDRPSDIAPGWR
jgi:hypothetical protein